MPPVTTEAPALETVTLTGVEVLKPGVWNSDKYELTDLQAMIDAFLQGNAGIIPPGKLGHNPEQQLAAKDGMPAIGYVERLYLRGEKLIADFRDVPKRVAALIKAKAYSKVSAEIYFNLPHEGKTLPRVLKGVAFLGGDIPAVSGLADIEALYGATREAVEAHYTLSDPPDGDVHTIAVDVPVAPMTWDLNAPLTNVAFTTTSGTTTAASTVTLAAADDDDPIAALMAYMERIDARMKGNKGMPAWRTFMREALTKLNGMKARGASLAQSQEEAMNPELLTTLGLPEDADDAAVLAKARELRDAATAPRLDEKQYVKAADHQQVLARLAELSAKDAKRDAETAVDAAIRQGKVVPAMREVMLSAAIQNPAWFTEYTAAAPALTLGASGTAATVTPDGGADDGKPKLTAAELSVARQLGNDPAKVVEFKERELAARR